MVDYIASALDSNRNAIVTFIDLQKVFNTVNTKVLTEKLKEIGIRV